MRPERPLGTRYVVPNLGYVRVKVGKGHHLAIPGGGWAYEHRLVAEEKLGRPLTSEDHIHHIDGNRANNAPENIMVTTKWKTTQLAAAMHCHFNTAATMLRGDSVGHSTQVALFSAFGGTIPLAKLFEIVAGEAAETREPEGAVA